MSKNKIIILAIVAALLVVSIVYETRLAAGAGALLLLVALIWGYVSNRRAPDGLNARSERGARELREEIAHEREKPVDL